MYNLYNMEFLSIYMQFRVLYVYIAGFILHPMNLRFLEEKYSI